MFSKLDPTFMLHVQQTEDWKIIWPGPFDYYKFDIFSNEI